MFQQPVIQPKARPAAQTPRPLRWQLAGHEVSQTMYYDAEKAKRSGRRVFFVTAGDSEMLTVADDVCRNCLGFGRMALEIVIGGPYLNAPQGKNGGENEEPTIHLRPAFHNGKWWQVARETYLCPVCSTEREIVL